MCQRHPITYLVCVTITSLITSETLLVHQQVQMTPIT